MNAQKIIETMAEHEQTVACAESLTGGLLCDVFVQVPGASKVFMGGIIAYDEGRKVTLLGVNSDTLAQHTAVSEETALEMARGAKERLNTDWALSTTGYAGPDGPDVGLVYIALAGPKDEKACKCRFHGCRTNIRTQTVQAALYFLELALLEQLF